MSGMRRNSQGVDVVITEEIMRLSPQCEHGPTLLFERYSGAGAVKRFFACSAYRDRTHCPFYQSLDDGIIAGQERKRPAHSKKSASRWYSRCQKTKSLREGERLYCRTCNLLLFKEDGGTHRGHVITEGISDWLLSHPSHLLRARSGNKSQAQYLFSEESTRFLVETIASLKFDRVLCVGVPRLHEALSQDRSTLKIDSLLLDIDERFAQFFAPSEFCRYNMFNHHFLDGSEATYRSFLQRNGGQGMVLVLDPPFGGLVEALVYGISQIMKACQEQGSSSKTELPVMWIFPYFLEKRIIAALPSFQMLDYKVSYENHTLFKNGSKSKKNSPVRIFTNIKPADVVLPASEGYRLQESGQILEYAGICRRMGA